jgi:hypothetical protein
MRDRRMVRWDGRTVCWIVGGSDGRTVCWMDYWSEVPKREILGMGRRAMGGYREVGLDFF